MSQKDLISVDISEADMTEIRTAIGVLNSKLLPRLRTLSPQERQELPKMGDRTMAFVQKAAEHARLNKDLVPSFLDLNAMTIDVKAVQMLRELSSTLNPVHEALSDSIVLSGSEAYQGALVFYSSVKSAVKVKVPNAVAIYDDLSPRFPGAPAKKKA
ncbi:MAG: hypothetical protein WCT14_15705 [Treponemataceae bacterium]